MRTLRFVFTVIALLVLGVGTLVPAQAQSANAEAYAQLLDLTKMFSGRAPFKCHAIVAVTYKGSSGSSLRDTSNLIYRNGATYYSSSRVERLEGPEGELIVSHELKKVSLHLSDSLRQIVQKELHLAADPELEALLEENTEGTDMANFKNFLINSCTVRRDKKGDLEEITFTPKKPEQAILLSVAIRFSQSQVRYYEYSYRDVYATDYKGNSRFRVIKTYYQDFQYQDVPLPPFQLSDLLQWNGWTVKLKKYLNYQLTVL